MSTIPEPQAPTFENIPSQATFSYEYKELMKSILEELDNSKHPHSHDVAGIALNEIVQKLMPFMENYNMEYTQGNIANGQKAASYSLSVVNYVETQYEAVGKGGYVPKPSGSSNPPFTPSAQDIKYAEAAQKAIRDFNSFRDETASAAKNKGIGDPFGSMGQNIADQLYEAIGEHSMSTVNLAADWELSFDMKTNDSGGIKPVPFSGGGGPVSHTNAQIMQDFNGAQNQAQSEAAYLQSESKIANETYQQYSATQHDIGQNIVNVEKAAVTSSQSAGN